MRRSISLGISLVVVLSIGTPPGTASQGTAPQIALIDSGIDPDHEEFCDGQVKQWRDLLHDRELPYDDLGHGTAVASLVGGQTLGVYPCVDLLVYKVLNANDRTTADLIASALRQAALDGADVINVSIWAPLPSPGAHQVLADAIADATRSGALVVWIAGNGGTMSTPGLGSHPSPIPADALPGSASPKVLIAGAAAPDGDRAPFSQRNPEVLAYGVGVDVAQAGGGTTIASGTSFAAPVLAGGAGQLLADGAPRDPSWLKWVLLHSAEDDLPDPYLDEGYGLFGDEALEEARTVARGQTDLPPPDHRDAAHLVSEGARSAESGQLPTGALPPGIGPERGDVSGR